MTHFVIASDNIDKKESVWLKAIQNRLQQAGHQVTNAGVGDSAIQNYGMKSAAKGKIGLFLVGGSDIGMFDDFQKGVGKYYHYDKMGVLFNSWSGSQAGTMSCDGIKNVKLGRAHDDHYTSSAAMAKISGQTAHEFFSKHSDKIFYACTDKSGVDGCNELADIAASQGYGSSSGSSGSSGSTTVNSQYSNPMIAGEKTFQEIISEICDGIDILFLCKKNHILVTDFEQIYSDALYLREHAYDKVRDEDIKLWQLEDGSYQLNVDQFGFYNAVIVYYNGGKIYEQFDDLVDVYGVQVKTYNDKTLTKSQAQAKAKAYLAAHVRDFNMGITASVLENGIDIGDIVTLKNPMTSHKYKKIPEYLFVQGVSISWDGDYIYTDLELQYGPESPERPEVPVTGVGRVSSSSSSGATDENGLIQIGNDLASKYKFSHSSSSYCNMRSVGSGDCFAWSAALWQELKNAGYTPRIIQYRTSYADNHRSVQYKNANGEWVDYPYGDTKIPWGPQATSNSKNGTVVADENGLGAASNTIC